MCIRDRSRFPPRCLPLPPSLLPSRTPLLQALVQLGFKCNIPRGRSDVGPACWLPRLHPPSSM
eukprot:2469066-Rhodomonas_salina.1